MRPRVLVLSRNYPNAIMPTLGLWVEGLVRNLLELCEVRVVSPVPYCPPLPAWLPEARFRKIARREQVHGVSVWHPRFLTGPGYSLHGLEADGYHWGVRGLVERLWQESPFDLIHAHFTYPDGVVAARLGRRFGVPVVITEHAPWRPWMDEYPRVRRQAVNASSRCTFLIAVSRYVRDTIVRFTGELEKLRVIGVGVDGSIFSPPRDHQRREPNRVVYVGLLKFVKGVDVLLEAIARLVRRRRDLRLLVVGGAFYRPARLHAERLRRQARNLGLVEHVEFLGDRPQSEVAALMGESAVLVLPSRAESFGAVLVEALACGTPVIATRCGGPEEIVTPEVGELVPPDDPDALAKAIERVLDSAGSYDPNRLREYALASFSWERLARLNADLYRAALEHRRTPRSVAPR